MATPMFSSPLKNNTAPSRSSLAMNQWVTFLVKSSHLYKEQQRIVDIFIYLIYATLIHKHDISKANTTKKSIDITDGVVMTDLLNRAKNLHSGLPIPKPQDRQLFLLKPREEIIASYLIDCRSVINFDESVFTADQFIAGKVPKHILIDHFFSLYREVFQKNLPGLPTFQFEHIFNENGFGDNREITSQLEMEQIIESIKQVLFKESANSDDNKAENKKQQQTRMQAADRFTVATNSDPKYKYLQRDRLLKRMDKFHTVLNEEKPLLMFNKESMECQRLHIDEFDQYYQRVIGIQKEIDKARGVVNKKDKQIHLLRQIIQNQTKVLENLDFDVGLLSNENVIKARIAAKEMAGNKFKMNQSGLSGTSRIIKNNFNDNSKRTILEQSMKSNKDVVSESRRLSKQIKLLQFNVEKQIKQGFDQDDTGRVMKRIDSGGSISQQNSESFIQEDLLHNRRNKVVQTNDFQVQVNIADTPQFEKGAKSKQEIQAQFMLQPPPTSMKNYNSDMSQQIRSVDLDEVPDGLVTSFDDQGNPKYTSSQLIEAMGRKKNASNDWMVEKWKEISQKLMQEKEQIQKEHEQLKERMEKYNRNSIDFSRIKGLQNKSSEFEMKFKKRDQEYSLLLSESTRMRNELDQALRINRPLANQLEQASNQIKSLREQNRQYRAQLLEMKMNNDKTDDFDREENKKNLEQVRQLRENIKEVIESQSSSSNKYIKVLLGMMEKRVKELQEKNSVLKQTVKRVTTQNLNKIPNRFS